MFVHFNNLKDDMPREIRRIAEFLDIEIDESKWEDINLHCSFDYMKENATQSVPLGGAFWECGAKTFIHKGVNGRWKDILSNDDSLKYENIAAKNLSDDCALWLSTGNMGND